MNITMLVLPTCPYCKRAERLIHQLQAEHEEYRKFNFEKQDERTFDNSAHNFDYYYVPSFFAGDEKLYEASPGDNDDIMLGKLKTMFDKLMLK